MTSEPSQRVLSDDEMTKIQQLIHSGTVDNIKLAIHLLQSVEASTEQWSQAFNSDALNQLWQDKKNWEGKVSVDPETFELLADSFHSSKILTQMLVDSLGVSPTVIKWDVLSELSEASLKVIGILGPQTELYAWNISYELHSYWNSLTNISTSVAKGFSNLKIYNPSTILSDEFIPDLSLNGLSSLNRDVAEALAEHEGDLQLEGLKSLSEEEADALGRHKGRLFLNGLKGLSEEAARGLSKHHGDIFLYGLESLSDEAARLLAQQQGSLFFWEISCLSDNTLIYLSRLNGILGLGCLNPLSDTGARALGNFKGDLYIDGLTSLSDLAAQALGNKEGGILGLPGLRNISEEGARALCNRRGKIEFNEEFLPPTVIKIFNDHNCNVVENDDK